MSDTSPEFEAFKAELQEMEDVFLNLVQQRHETGQVEYGEFTFLENDMIRMMLEELADVVNYARMHAVKLLMYAKSLEDELEKSDTPNIGFQSFKGTKDVGWNQ